jgi:hypothetical protein
LLSGYAFDNGVAVSVYINNAGVIEVITPSRKAFPFRNNRALVVVEKNAEKFEYLYGIVNRKGDLVVPIKYLDMLQYSDGKTYVMNKQERGYIDTNGNFLFRMPFGLVGYGFTEGLSPVSSTNSARFGFIDTTGRTVIPFQYYEAGNFSEGLARVFSHHRETGHPKFGFINREGLLVITNIYEETSFFQEGYCFVSIPLPNDDLI